MKAWLNGGLIGLAISLVLGYVASMSICWNAGPYPAECVPTPFNWTLFISFLLIGFILGILIGYFVGKIKSKK